MNELTQRILETLQRPSYSPVKIKILAKRMNVYEEDYSAFRRTVKELIREGKIEVLGNNTLRVPNATKSTANGIIGVYRRTNSGLGFVRPDGRPGEPPPVDIRIREGREKDASSGDRVLVQLRGKPSRSTNTSGEIVEILERATRHFVGTYFERDGTAFVRVDGTVFAHSISVGDPGTKGAKSQDKVQIEMVRFPSAEDRGEAVIVEAFGPLHQPGVDLISIIKAFNLPEAFPEEALEEARSQASKFHEDDLKDREDFTQQHVITIDPVDAKDFDDAINVEIDPKTKHWILTVHIADVSHFVRPGGPLDAEARKRATSIYLPRKVIPMFPEVISNGLASLQEGKVRYVKTVQMEFTPHLQKADVRFFNGAIRVAKRFTYEQVQEQYDKLGEPVEGESETTTMLRNLRDLALLLRKNRKKRGSLELTMPEAVLDYDTDGRVTGAHFAVNNLSHQVVEECMLSANEAVAEHFSQMGVPFLRRVHPAPNPLKLQEFASFAALLGHPIKKSQDRFELQALLEHTADKPERAAIHFSLLRSLKQATYSPIQDEHYALASIDYCHFTSPIRRYPDLQVHRLLDRFVRTGKASADEKELIILGDHCSKMERRAETAERELVKLKILQYLTNKLGLKLDAVITGVAEYGFFAQAEEFPAEGLVHISSLTDDFYTFEESEHTLFGRRTKNRFRLGDRVKVEVARVDIQKRMLDLRVVTHTNKPIAKPEKRYDKPDRKRRR